MAKTKTGFTLVELMVAMGIMGIMALVVGPRFAGMKRMQSMRAAKTQIANDVRYAQDSALSGVRLLNYGATPPGGYGINFNSPNSYIIFGDIDKNRSYSGANELLETVPLPSGITIVSGLGINFVTAPPYGESYVNGTTGNFTVTLVDSIGTTGTVDVNSSGKVTIN